MVEFIYIDTEYEPFRGIVRSMCLGMQVRGVVDNQDILTYAGSQDPRTVAPKRNMVAVVQVSVVTL